MTERTPEEEDHILTDQHVEHAVESPEDCHGYDDFFVEELPEIDMELYLLHLRRVNAINERRKGGAD